MNMLRFFISSYLKNNEKNLTSFFFNPYDLRDFDLMCYTARRFYTPRKFYATGK